MKTIGIISDTHDNLQMIAKARQIFSEKNVDIILHAGDFVAPFAVKSLLNGWQKDFRGVFGNNDGEKEGLRSASGDRIFPGPYFFTWEGISIGMMHAFVESDSRLSGCDLVVFGHTHTASVKQKKVHDRDVLFINPGEGGGWVTNIASVALVHIPALKEEFIIL